MTSLTPSSAQEGGEIRVGAACREAEEEGGGQTEYVNIYLWRWRGR